MDSLIRSYISKYNEIFEEHETHRETTFTVDMKLYDTGFEQAGNDLQNDASSHQGIFGELKRAVQALFSDDHTRFAKLSTHKAQSRNLKAGSRQSQYLIASQTHEQLFEGDKHHVLAQFTFADSSESKHVSMLVSSIQSLLAMFETWLRDLVAKHDGVFDLAMQEYSRRFEAASYPVEHRPATIPCSMSPPICEAGEQCISSRVGTFLLLMAALSEVS